MVDIISILFYIMINIKISLVYDILDHNAFPEFPWIHVTSVFVWKEAYTRLILRRAVLVVLRHLEQGVTEVKLGTSKF